MLIIAIKKINSIKFIIGIDEAGRGPLAGPVAVAAVAVKRGYDWRPFDLKDSKQLSPRRRTEWYQWLLAARRQGRLDFAVSLVGEKIIDERGIVTAVRLGLERVLRRLKLAPESCRVLLDGGLRAPKFYLKQKTIIRGDSLVPIIMLASIAAKVRRDRRLISWAARYPGYSFEIHKGYGTKAHYQALRRLGLTPVHRRSFCRSLLN